MGLCNTNAHNMVIACVRKHVKCMFADGWNVLRHALFGTRRRTWVGNVWCT